MLISLAFAGKYLTVDPNGGALLASADHPGPDQEILVRNLTRPDADNFGRGDILLMRFTKTNLVPSLKDRLSVLMVEGRRESAVVARTQAPRIANRPRELVPASYWPDQPLDQYVSREDAPAPSEILVGVRDVSSGASMDISLVMLVPGAGLAPGTTGPFVSPDTPDYPATPGARPSTPSSPAVRQNPWPVFAANSMRSLQFALNVAGSRVVATLGGATASFRVEPHPVRVALRAADLHVVTEPNGQVHGDAIDRWEWEELTIRNEDRPFDRRLFHDDRVSIRAWTGQRLSPRPASSNGVHEVWAAESSTLRALTLQVKREQGAGEVTDGERIRFVNPANEAMALGIAADGSHPLQYGRLPRERTVFGLRLTRDLHLCYHAEHKDHAMVTTYPLVRRPGYQALGPRARVYLGCRPGTVALKAYFHERATDTITTATEAGEATPNAQGYRFLGVQGFVSASPALGTVPLKQYYSDEFYDNLLASTPELEATAAAHAYRFAWIEGHVLPAQPLEVGRPVPGLDPRDLLGGANVPATVTGGIGPVRPSAPPAPPRPVRALVLAGGGAKGAFEAGAAQYLWQTLYRDSRPDIICGVSAGAINAAKLAEGGDGAHRRADELVALWKSFAATKGRIFRRDHYLKVMHALGLRAEGSVGDMIGAVFVGLLTGGLLLPPFGALAGGYLGALAGIDLAKLPEKGYRLMTAMHALCHSQHSMEPLRQLIAANLFPERLAESPTQLRVGVTDAKTGQFFNVTGPRHEWQGRLRGHGYVEVEPDHQPGDTWLTKPLWGTSGYVMRLEDAIYASSVRPAAMEPLVVDLRKTTVVRDDAFAPSEPFTLLPMELPVGLRELLDVTNQAAVISSDPPRGGVFLGDGYLPSTRTTPGFWDAVERALDLVIEKLPVATQEYLARQACQARDGNGRGQNSWLQYFFDGGLRDTMPIRTALRMGATEIMVLTGDRLHSMSFGYALPSRAPRGSGGLGSVLAMSSAADPLAAPLFQHLMALMNVWTNDVARADMMLALAHNDGLAWAAQAAARLSPDARASLERELARQTGQRGLALLEALGASSPLGGQGKLSYGAPLAPPCKISYICPDRELVDALDFENAGGIEDAIALGYRAAQRPLSLT